MSSFVARAESALTGLAALHAQAKDAAAQSTIEAARKRASTARQNLAAVVQAREFLGRQGIPAASISGPLQKELPGARRNLRSVASNVVGLSTTEIAGRVNKETVQSALDAAERLAKTLTATMNKQVEAKRAELCPPDIDKPIVHYPGASYSTVARLQRIQGALKVKVENVPAEQLGKRLADIVSDVQTWQRDRAELDRGLSAVDPEIQNFLRLAASEGGAPWSAITLRVAEWLQDAENAAALRIVLS